MTTDFLKTKVSFADVSTEKLKMHKNHSQHKKYFWATKKVTSKMSALKNQTTKMNPSAKLSTVSLWKTAAWRYNSTHIKTN